MSSRSPGESARKTDQVSKSHAAAQLGVKLSESLRRREFWLLTATLFLAAFSITGAVVHLSALLSDRGIAVQGAAYAVLTLGGAGLCGRLLTGLLLDRFFGREYPCVYSQSAAVECCFSQAPIPWLWASRRC